MTRRFAGAVASCLVLLSGLWLILAPFALGVQPKGSDWKNETFTDVWTGIGLGVVGLVGIIVFAAAIKQNLRDRGVFPQAAAVEPEQRPAEPAPAAVTAPASDLDRLLGPLVQALSADLAQNRPSREAAQSRQDMTQPRQDMAQPRQDGRGDQEEPSRFGQGPDGLDTRAPVNVASPVTNGRSVTSTLDHQTPAHQIHTGEQEQR